MIFTPK